MVCCVTAQLEEGMLNTYLLLLSKLIPQLQHMPSSHELMEDTTDSDGDDCDMPDYDNQVGTCIMQ